MYLSFLFSASGDVGQRGLNRVLHLRLYIPKSPVQRAPGVADRYHQWSYNCCYLFRRISSSCTRL
jgi:hypothetical protein